MGIIALKGIEVVARIGVEEAERRTGRNFIVDIEVEFPLNKAGQSDSIKDILDYSVLSSIIHRQMKEEYRLMEACARSIAEKVLLKYPDLKSMRIKMQKKNPFLHGNISFAIIEWRYPDDW